MYDEVRPLSSGVRRGTGVSKNVEWIEPREENRSPKVALRLLEVRAGRSAILVG